MKRHFTFTSTRTWNLTSSWCFRTYTAAIARKRCSRRWHCVLLQWNT